MQLWAALNARKYTARNQPDVALRHRIGLDCSRERSVVRVMGHVSQKTNQPISPEIIAAEIARLSGLQTKELQLAWRAEFRRDPPKGLWRELLLRTLAWQLQARAFGDHDKRTLKFLEAYRQKKPGDQRCQRLKSGTVLVREFQGVRHTVTIAPEGFIWQEKTWPSLTAIARIITGTNWNGPRFFGLREGTGSKPGKQQERAA